jgi:hypothetical protein
MKLEVTKDRAIRYANCRIENTPTSSFPTMVQITKGPSRLKSIIGKRFVTLEKAILAVDEMNADTMIGRQRTTVRLEMAEKGIVNLYEL